MLVDEPHTFITVDTSGGYNLSQARKHTHTQHISIQSNASVRPLIAQFDWILFELNTSVRILAFQSPSAVVDDLVSIHNTPAI